MANYSFDGNRNGVCRPLHNREVVWIPPGTPHGVLSRARRRLLNLYLAPSLCVALPRSPTAVPARALLIELIRGLSRAADLTQPDYWPSVVHMVSMEMLRLHNV